MKNNQIISKVKSIWSVIPILIFFFILQISFATACVSDGDCSLYQFCYGSVCIDRICIDTDGGPNQNVYGLTNNNENPTNVMNDTCFGDHEVIEWYCNEYGFVAHAHLYCDSNKFCKDGACTDRICTDTDRGPNQSVYGQTYNNENPTNIMNDTCFTDKEVIEWYCDPNGYVTDAHLYCDYVWNNEKCVNGSCKKACTNDSNCSNGEKCIDGFCKQVDCCKTSECDYGEKCIGKVGQELNIDNRQICISIGGGQCLTSAIDKGECTVTDFEKSIVRNCETTDCNKFLVCVPDLRPGRLGKYWWVEWDPTNPTHPQADSNKFPFVSPPKEGIKSKTRFKNDENFGDVSKRYWTEWGNSIDKLYEESSQVARQYHWTSSYSMGPINTLKELVIDTPIDLIEAVSTVTASKTEWRKTDEDIIFSEGGGALAEAGVEVITAVLPGAKGGKALVQKGKGALREAKRLLNEAKAMRNGVQQAEKKIAEKGTTALKEVEKECATKAEPMISKEAAKEEKLERELMDLIRKKESSVQLEMINAGSLKGGNLLKELGHVQKGAAKPVEEVIQTPYYTIFEPPSAYEMPMLKALDKAGVLPTPKSLKPPASATSEEIESAFTQAFKGRSSPSIAPSQNAKAQAARMQLRRINEELDREGGLIGPLGERLSDEQIGKMTSNLRRVIIEGERAMAEAPTRAYSR